MGAFAADPQPTTTTHTPPTCSPNLGGSVADPDYDNPSFSIFNSGNYSQSPSLTLALLLEAWPVNSYPYVVQLPSGSVFVAAGHLLFWPCTCVCLTIYELVSYLCAPLHLWRVGALAVQGGVLMLHCSFLGFNLACSFRHVQRLAYLQLLAACLLFYACRPVLPFALLISILSAYLYC